MFDTATTGTTDAGTLAAPAGAAATAAAGVATVVEDGLTAANAAHAAATQREAAIAAVAGAAAGAARAVLSTFGIDRSGLIGGSTRRSNVAAKPFLVQSVDLATPPTPSPNANTGSAQEVDEVEVDLMAKLAAAESTVEAGQAAVAAHDASWAQAYAELTQLAASRLLWTPEEAIANLARMSGLQMFLRSHATVRNTKLADMRGAQAKKDAAQEALYRYRIGRQARRDAQQALDAKRAALQAELDKLN